MFIVFMPLHILLCDEVMLFYFVHRNHSRIKSELDSNEFVIYRVFRLKERVFL
jgi:hypothetical protein